MFYCKNTLLLFLNLKRDRKLYMEKAENSIYPHSTYPGCGYKGLLAAFSGYSGKAFGGNVFVERCLSLVLSSESSKGNRKCILIS